MMTSTRMSPRLQGIYAESLSVSLTKLRLNFCFLISSSFLLSSFNIQDPCLTSSRPPSDCPQGFHWHPDKHLHPKQGCAPCPVPPVWMPLVSDIDPDAPPAAAGRLDGLPALADDRQPAHPGGHRQDPDLAQEHPLEDADGERRPSDIHFVDLQLLGCSTGILDGCFATGNLSGPCGTIEAS